jgi:hypothetical protein
VRTKQQANKQDRLFTIKGKKEGCRVVCTEL